MIKHLNKYLDKYKDTRNKENIDYNEIVDYIGVCLEPILDLGFSQAHFGKYIGSSYSVYDKVDSKDFYLGIILNPVENIDLLELKEEFDYFKKNLTFENLYVNDMVASKKDIGQYSINDPNNPKIWDHVDVNSKLESFSFYKMKICHKNYQI